jgi:hypothetical protein
MLVETGGVKIYTPGRGNFEAAKRGEQASHRERRNTLLSTAAKQTTEN